MLRPNWKYGTNVSKFHLLSVLYPRRVPKGPVSVSDVHRYTPKDLGYSHDFEKFREIPVEQVVKKKNS